MEKTMNTIRYAFGDSSLGPFVAALSRRGLAFVAFDAGIAELEARFPDADLVEDQTALSETVGTTATYGEIAARLGVPRQAREVGEACAANKLAIAVPCHRVVKKDGSISGYRWGVQRKRKLLEREHTARLLQPAVVLPNGMAAN